MSNSEKSRQVENEEMAQVMKRPLGGRLAYYSRKCGPGWLQGAITLGGGSLAGALYIGTLSGYHMLWLQPLAMIIGVIMLSAIAYVILSTSRRPFGAVNEFVSPALGWAWLIATLLANIVWCLPQFSLANAALKQNLFQNPEISPWAISPLLFIIAFAVIWCYDSGAKGIVIFETILKIMVAIVVVSFIGVVVAMAGRLPWGEIFSGFIPNFRLLNNPTPAYETALAAVGPSSEIWRDLVVSSQKDRMITAFATAVGINMTFFLPYSMLKKNWGKNHRGLAIFDLSTGLVIPFVLATGCVVIASAYQFHGKSGDIFAADGSIEPEMANAYYKVMEERLTKDPVIKGDLAVYSTPSERTEAIRAMIDALPKEEKTIGAMLANRDAFNLANSLTPLTGPTVAQYIFGIGVFGMALSTIIMLMLINGFTVCEMLGVEPTGWPHRIGCMIPGVIGIFYHKIWTGDALIALSVPTSVIGGALIPIAYVTFLLLMNSRTLMGDAMPRGRKRIIWNVLMVSATGIATAATIWNLKGRTFGDFPIGNVSLFLLAVLFATGVFTFLAKNRVSGDRPS